MMQRQAVWWLALMFGLACGSGQPNVLLIIVDDLRPALGCYGDPLALTPNIDTLSQQGTIFTRAYAQQALCGPSRTSFLTSRRPDTTKLYDVHSYWRKHAGNFTSLPQYFKEHGYHTAAAGKVFHPGIVSNHNDDQPYSWSETPFHPPTQAHKQDPVCLGSDGALHTNIYCPVQVEDQPGGSLPDIQTTQYATSWLRQWAAKEAKTKEPFFFAVGFHKPHIPLKFPKQFLDLYPISTVPLAPNRHLPKGLPPVAWNPWNNLRKRDDIAALNVSYPYGPIPDFYARYIRQGYYAATTYTDALIGDLLSTINSLFPDTIIAFTGDHGWSLGEHQEWAKFSNFEVSTRVPFIISRWRSSAHNPFQGFSTFFSNTEASDSHIQQMKHSHGYSEDYRLLKSYRMMNSSMAGTAWISSHTEETIKDDAVKGAEHNGLVELVDLFPTLVDLAGLPALSSCPEDSQKVEVCTEGTSLTPLLDFHGKRKFSSSKGNKGTSQGSNTWSNSNFRKRNSVFIPWQQHRQTEVTKDRQESFASRSGVKKAAFSQYPRPGPNPSRNPDSDQPHTRDATIMGYSVRTNRFRYTAWLKFNNATYKPDWEHIIAEELYDHKIDSGEDYNVIGKALYTKKRIQLYKMLTRGWKHAVL